MFKRLCILTLLLLGSHIAYAENVALKVGDMAPDFQLRDPRGEVVKLSDYRGKVVVMSFWASWCEPCRKELPILEGLQKKAGAERLQVLAVNWKEDRERFLQVGKALKDVQMRLLWDLNGRAGRQYGVKAIPHMLMIGKDGRITFINIGYGESELDGIVDAVNAAMMAPG